ncbi:hypothetical protein [Paracoccus sp. (in: a-proteobacteria)]|uniref:hypothetical protein n=1 Tax=Paracoccus sp. TaxID=267 RepID=UPI0026E06D49|nr:hypothetical protein [Paracoccus sp. (in: a-proteobacteria)]MDO5647949.1 hypothetical protein [Paracoccus sp. (in: a-proteobacteria)]
MIGVVVWSSSATEKAVIWCEDQGALACLLGQENTVDMAQWPQPGDLVELDSVMDGNLRHARNVTMISEHACPKLPELLANSTQQHPHLHLVSSRPAPAQNAQTDLPDISAKLRACACF